MLPTSKKVRSIATVDVNLSVILRLFEAVTNGVKTDARKGRSPPVSEFDLARITEAGYSKKRER